jgi:hypothetical protein
MSPRFLHYIEDDGQAEELKGKVIDSVWFGTYGNLVILFSDSTDISVGIVNGEMIVERREWKE